MPSRVVRGEINESESLARVSPLAELAFRALIVAVDDFGRLDARAAKLKAALFPMRDAFSAAKVFGWIEELAAEGCVLLYEVDGRPYLQLTGWEKHRGKGRRAESSKYPEPNDPSISRKSEDLQSNPPVLRGTRDEKRGTYDETDEKQNAPSALVTEAEGDVMDAFRLHGKNLRSSAARRKLIATRLREYTAADLANAVHGYQYTHRQGSNGEFDPAKHFKPETIFRASKIDGYIEAAAEAHGIGLTPPFKPDRILSKNERVMKDFFENDTSPLNPLAGLGEPKRWT